MTASGLMHYSIGPYRPFDIELVAAFDIDRRKVGRPADNWSTENLFAAAQAEPIVRFARQFPQIDVRFYNPAQDPIQQIGELTTGADVVWIGNWGGDERAEQIRDHLMAESPEQMRQHIQLLTASETRRQERAGNAVETIRTRHNCDLRAEQLEHICETLDGTGGIMMDAHASNILLCLRYGIGDLIMELPVIDRLREVLPQARITGLGAEPAVEILDHDCRLDLVVSIQHWGIRHLGDPADESIQRQFADWLASNRFDLILDPSHAPEVVGQIIHQQNTSVSDSDPACLEIGLAQGMDGLSAVKHAVWQGWGLDVPPSHTPAIRLRFEELGWAERVLEDHQLTDGLVAISPGARTISSDGPSNISQRCAAK